MNFKVCRNSSSHLRGNVYIHYKSLESAMAAYHSANGRFFAGKQVTCEYVNVTKWRVAICGEYMKSRYKTCSRGVACNFIHCFRNPGCDYEWADWDKPPPRYWVKEMTALFGYHGEDDTEEQNDRGSSRSSSRKTPDLNSKRKLKRRSESRGHDICSMADDDDDDDDEERIRRRRDKGNPTCEEKFVSNHSQYIRMQQRHNKQSVNHCSDEDPKEDRYRKRRGHSKSIETSSSKRSKTSEEHRKRYDLSGDDGDFSDNDKVYGGDRCSKSKRSRKHNNSNSDYWVERVTYGDNSRSGDRKWRSDRIETIELDDRWDPQGTESGE